MTDKGPYEQQLEELMQKRFEEKRKLLAQGVEIVSEPPIPDIEKREEKKSK